MTKTQALALLESDKTLDAKTLDEIRLAVQTDEAPAISTEDEYESSEVYYESSDC